jgi:cytochrome b6-f complex iron-sulfur subunit
MMATITQSPTDDKQPLSRREFLYYIGGASLALITVGTCGGVLWYTLPDSRAGEIAVDMEAFTRRLPHPILVVFYVQDADAVFSRLEAGWIVQHRRCVYETYPPLVRWVDRNNRFECPECGSKYQLDGTYIEGPASRGLDRFAFRVTTSDGTVLTSTDGNPIDIRDAVDIVIDTQAKILGADRA